MNATNTNIGGWEKSELRGQLNSGGPWTLLPSDFKDKVKPVKKMTDNLGGGKVSTPTVTIDKMFLLSRTEVWGGSYRAEGSQYENFVFKGVTASNCLGAQRNYRWTRSVANWNRFFYRIESDGSMSNADAARTLYAQPAWCF